MSKLHIDSLTKSYDGKNTLKDIYLGCETGKIVGILGRNGAGKSTLLKIIFGTVKGDHQYIRVDDKVLQNQWDRKNKIAYLPQDFFLPKGVKIKNLIPIFCNEENSKKLIESEMMKPLLDETSRNLSGGEKKVVEALLIIFSDSQFILLDYLLSDSYLKPIKDLKELQQYNYLPKSI